MKLCLNKKKKKVGLLIILEHIIKIFHTRKINILNILSGFANII